MARREEQWHCVAQGECLVSIAHLHGVDDWRSLHEHPLNEPLRRLRPDPHVLYPGDRVYIPPGTLPSQPVRKGQTHRFRGQRRRTRLHVQLRDPAGQPLAGVRYELVALDETFQGTTGDDGSVEQQVDVRARDALLRLHGSGPPRELRLAIGHLDPPDTESGARGRLKNLGWTGGPDTDPLRAFQAASEMEAHGEIDDATREKLLAMHEV